MSLEGDLADAPEELHEYRILRLIGRGAMGRVYLAEDPLLQRLVAIKLIAAGAPSRQARARFYTEARAIARLSHPNVVTVHRAGEARGRPFLVSEYIRGKSLDQIDTPIPWQRALEIAVGLSRGLAAAHRAGVLHRDIKPANSMLAEDGAIKLLDFGLAELSAAVDAAPPAGGAAPAAAALATAVLPAATLPAAAPGQAATVTLPAPVTTLGAAADVTATLPPAVAGAWKRAALPSAAASTPVDVAGTPADGEEPPRCPMGTPLYMAPEIWRGEPATPRSDVYGMGVLLYELCTGQAPHEGVPLSSLGQAVLRGVGPIAEVAPNLEPRFAAVIDRSLALDPGARFESGEALREALERIGAEPQAAAVPEGNPYRGLLPFEAEHRALFFGRGDEVRAVLDRLRAGRFVLVAGDSGAGKSSLCRAGVLPAVAGGGLGDGPPPRAVTVVPGRRPLAALAAALAPLAGMEEGALAAALRDAPWDAVRALRRGAGAGVLVLVDPLEELCTLAEPEAAREAAGALAALVDPASGVRLLATARGDFLARLAALPELGGAISAAIYLLRPLPRDGLRAVIAGPAERMGFSFESEALLDALTEAAADAEGGLPLLQFALAELWEARDVARRVIPAAALDALGGVRGALARHADQVIARMPPPERRQARAILLRLVTAEGTRARRTEAELVGSTPAPEARAALEALVRGRLVVAREAEEGGAYEIAHEALRRGWDTLEGWLGRDAERRVLAHRLGRAAAEWERLGRAPEALWSGRRLAEAAVVEPGALEPSAAAFLSASRRGARRRRLGALAAVTVLIATAAGLRAGAARDVARRAEAQVARAQGMLVEARAQRDDEHEKREAAFARFEAQDQKAGEALWRQVLELRARADGAYARAAQGVEVALQLGADGAPVRGALAEALAERAELAARRRDFRLRDELLARLEAYDDRGAQRQRLGAPAPIAITTTPSGARVALAQFEPRGGRRELPPARPLGATPLADELPAGSYVLSFEAEGRAPVRLPILLEPGSATQLRVTLPRAADVPVGFVYVPAGHFLFGDNDLDERDLDGAGEGYDPQPLHRAWTGAYLVGRDEVTFGDWIVFLRALPPGERRARAPAISGEFHAVGLEEAEGGRYRLTLRSAQASLTALEGEPIRYPGRTLRAAQDWLRMPVCGVSYEDVNAYAAWLDRTGRVPGARPCTEREWERAARGADDRLFPGGDQLAADDANHDVTYGRDPGGFGPDEVGSHPASDSPFGVRDLAGNVWEWAVSSDGKGEPVLRGGSFYQSSLNSLSINRSPGEPKLRSALIGVRICASPPSEAIDRPPDDR